jgi:hypothetical protein
MEKIVLGRMPLRAGVICGYVAMLGISGGFTKNCFYAICF